MRNCYICKEHIDHDGKDFIQIYTMTTKLDVTKRFGAAQFSGTKPRNKCHDTQKNASMCHRTPSEAFIHVLE